MDVVVALQAFVCNWLENKHPLFYDYRIKKLLNTGENVFKSENFLEN